MPNIARDELGNLYSITIDSATGAQIVTLIPGSNQTYADNSALQLICSSLRLIGVLASNEIPDMGESSDYLMVLNQMIDAWNAERLTIFTTRADDYTLQAGKQTYTLGAGGDFNASRPAQIENISAILTVGQSSPLEIPIPLWSVEDWQKKFPIKNVNSTFPLGCYDDGGFPFRRLSFWPVPQQTNSIRIYSWQSLDIPATLDSTMSFPPGYAEAFRYNLAVRLAAETGTPVPGIVQSIAVESLARIKTMNAPDLTLTSDLCANKGGWNYKADLFGIPF